MPDTRPESHFDPTAIVRAASDTFTVRRVFGEAYERDGVLVIPVAKVMGATGSGGGAGTHRPDSEAEAAAVAETGGPVSEGDGGGGGFGLRVRPVGVYVVDKDGTHWRPALDLNRVILGGQAVAAIAVSVLGTALAVRAILRRR